nr:hypothetical protein [Haliscomenobacter sp.]
MVGLYDLKAKPGMGYQALQKCISHRCTAVKTPKVPGILPSPFAKHTAHSASILEVEP